MMKENLSDPETRTCARCNRLVSFNASFCGGCGSRFPSSEERETQQKEASQNANESLYANSHYPDITASPEFPENKEKTNKKVETVIAIASISLFLSTIYFVFGFVGICVLVALIFVFILFASKGQSPTDQPKGGPRKLM